MRGCVLRAKVWHKTSSRQHPISLKRSESYRLGAELADGTALAALFVEMVTLRG